MSTLKVVTDEKARIEIAFPMPFTAEHWRRYHLEQAKFNIAGGTSTAIFVGGYAGTLAVIEYGHYEDEQGVKHNLKEEGFNVPAYVMTFVSIEGKKMLDIAIEIPKFSSPTP